ncbi:MAG TPA: hypothetical protein VM912_01330 [Terriglobales bacterium]|nr:hypothetical protein [Terriglobales bacterium]
MTLLEELQATIQAKSGSSRLSRSVALSAQQTEESNGASLDVSTSTHAKNSTEIEVR